MHFLFSAVGSMSSSKSNSNSNQFTHTGAAVNNNSNGTTNINKNLTSPLVVGGSSSPIIGNVNNNTPTIVTSSLPTPTSSVTTPSSDEHLPATPSTVNANSNPKSPLKLPASAKKKNDDMDK